jgi:hypothetical protein
VAALILRALVMLLPGALLLAAVARTTGRPQLFLVIGSGFHILVCCLSFFSVRTWREPLGPVVITLYLIALSWLWLSADPGGDWYAHFAQSLLLIVPLGLFAVQQLTNSGAPALRRCRLLAQRLANRRDWPADLSACRNLPDVKAFREALHVDPTPALALLQHPRLAVRVAALAALEFRHNWRPTQAALVLQLAQKAPEPEVRAATISALANADDRLIIESVAEFLHDPSWEVRRAATEALLWDSERRWTWIRHAVRQNLADPAFQDDGPLECEGQLFTGEVLNDLCAWASEKGILAIRAAQTVAVHYAQALSEQPGDALLPELRDKLANPHAPSALRLEIARLFQRFNLWEPALLDKLLGPANPAPLRLFAVEALLQRDGDHGPVIAALYDIARLPNREIALATADVVQRHLGIDLGLPIGQPLPAIHSRLAADVTRRVMLWAAEREAKASSAS